MNGDERKKVEFPQISTSVGAGAVMAIVLIAFAIGMVYTGFHHIAPGEIALIKNNVTGAETVQLTDGVIIHLPFGMTDVYRLDKTQQVFRMTAQRGAGDRPGVDSVRIKTRDGSNITADVEVVYSIIPDEESVRKIIRTIGPGDAFKKELARSYARSLVRDAFGTLLAEQVTDPERRTEQISAVREKLNAELGNFGLKVIQVSAIDFRFDLRYQELVNQKAQAYQFVSNQEAAQETARQEQARAIEEASRELMIAEIEAEGIKQKAIVEREGWKEQTILRAEGQARQMQLEGEQALAVAESESAAILAEGLKRAEGVKKLSGAYEEGGLSLVREALAKKLQGAVIQGRPYTLESRVERLRLEGDLPVGGLEGAKPKGEEVGQ